MSTNTRNGGTGPFLNASCYLEQTWRWVATESCDQICSLRTHTHTSQAAVARNRSMNVVCQSSLATLKDRPCFLDLGAALFLHLFFFFFIGGGKGFAVIFERLATLGKELQTHKRGGGRPCIPTGLSNRFHPQALSCCFSRRLLFSACASLVGYFLFFLLLPCSSRRRYSGRPTK